MSPYALASIYDRQRVINWLYHDIDSVHTADVHLLSRALWPSTLCLIIAVIHQSTLQRLRDHWKLTSSLPTSTLSALEVLRLTYILIQYYFQIQPQVWFYRDEIFSKLPQFLYFVVRVRCLFKKFTSYLLMSFLSVMLTKTENLLPDLTNHAHFVLKLKQEPQTNANGNINSTQSGSLAAHDQSIYMATSSTMLTACAMTTILLVVRPKLQKTVIRNIRPSYTATSLLMAGCLS